MRSRLLFPLALALLCVTAFGQGPGFRCGAGRDLVVQALEEVSAQSPDPEIVHANELLKRAAAMCSSLGDAWYYRSLMERKLRNERGAQFALGRAQLIGSEAMEQAIDPFHLATPTTPQAPLPQGARWALVVGIGKFVDKDLNTLRYAADDAQMFAGVLRDPKIGNFPPDHVHVLLNEGATTRNIKASLNWIARQAKPEDLVVVYVATHGSRDLDSVGGINYLITADTEGGSTEDQDALYATALPVIDLVNTVATRIHALRTAVFLDACYAGSARATGMEAARSHSLDERTLRQFRQGSGRIILSAAKADQESNESARLAHGFFTYYLVKALRANGGALPLTAVYADVHQQVMTHVAAELKSFHVAQEPVMSRSSETTDFGLGTERQPSNAGSGGGA